MAAVLCLVLLALVCLAAVDASDAEERFSRLRQEMVREQIAEPPDYRDPVEDPEVLEAMRRVRRHLFVKPSDRSRAYGDHPIPIGYGQTISQPYIVAFMAEAAALEPGDRVLEIGTGSGYGAAVLGRVAAEVFTVEIVPELAAKARQVLEALEFDNVHVRTGNGWLGWPEHAPYDAIVVTAAPDKVPEALEDQLARGGTLVIPVGALLQDLQVLRKTARGLEEVRSLPVRFVPMVGEPPDTGDFRG